MSLSTPAAGGPLHVLVNPSSGREDTAAVIEAVRAELTASGRPHALHVADRPAELPGLARQLAEQASRDRGTVVAVGGDGTLNAVAQAAWAVDVPMGVLPQGTFNYFGRAHGIPADAGEATRALLAGRAQPVQLGCVDHRLFLVNASLGLYPQILEDRETFQATYGRSRGHALLAMLSTLMGRQRPMQLTLEHGGATQTKRALTLFVCNNRLQLEQLGIAEAPAVEAGELVALLLQPVRPSEMAGLVLRGAIGRLGESERVLRFAFERLGVVPSRLARGRVKVALDGEVMWLDAPLRFVVAARPLWLVKPVPSAPSPQAAQADAAAPAPALALPAGMVARG